MFILKKGHQPGVYVPLRALFLVCFTEMFVEYSSTFHKTFVQIGEFDWLSGRLKGSIFVKMFKYLLLRNHKG